MTTDQVNLFWSQLLIEELHRLGVDYFVICPGSRSTPLVLALAQHVDSTKIIHHDERGAAYHALGYIRATGRPSAVVTTSGTAAANLFPAVVEASMDCLPLVLLTADRPPELQNCGANQTINQVNLFGEYVRAFCDLPCPDDDPDLPGRLTQVDEALSAAAGNKPGPVHLNCHYRKPLVPSPQQTVPLDMMNVMIQPGLDNWAADIAPFVALSDQTHEMPRDLAHQLADLVCGTESGLLIVGRLDTNEERHEVLQLSKTLGWPTLADITSGLALTQEPGLIHHHDTILSSGSFRQTHRPAAVIHVGGRFVSKWLLEFLREAAPENYVHNSADSQPVDPAHVVTQALAYDNVSFCSSLRLRLETIKYGAAPYSDWRTAGEVAKETVKQAVDDEEGLTEPVIARLVSGAQSAATAMFLASSMPIRDMDMFAAASSGLVPVASNRGASGIDGIIASATGYALGLGQPTTLIIGDQALLHDLSSLPLVPDLPVPLTIVVINNNGGRIFEQLPVAEHAELIEPFFVAPHDLTFEKIAESFGISYRAANTRAGFEKAYAEAVKSGFSSIVEATVDPVLSGEHRGQIVQAVRAAIERL